MTTQLAVAAALGRSRRQWTTTRFRNVAFRRDDQRGESSAELLSLESIGRLVPRLAGRQTPSETSLPRYALVDPGDLVVNPMWLTGGSVAVSDIRGAVSPDYRVFALDREAIHPRFLHHTLRSAPYLEQYRLFVRADTTFDRRIQQRDLDNLLIALPPLHEQRRIADFLDDQVARIDAVIERANRETALLEALTRAQLNEVLWSGHACQPLRRIVTDVTSGPRGWGDLVAESGVPFLRIANLPTLGPFARTEGLVFLDPPEGPEARRASLREGDVLMGITASLGNAAVVSAEFSGGAFSQHVARLRLWPGVNPWWLGWVLQSDSMIHALRLASYGGTKLGLGLDEVRSLSIPNVDPGEQARAVERLRPLWAGYSQGLSLFGSRAAFLVEYKQALISAAVSGEFDVATASGRALPTV